MVEVVLLSLMVGDGLFKLALWRSVVVDGRLFVGVGRHGWVSFVVVGLLFGMELLGRVFAGGWLLDGALRSVFAQRWRIYCMMLVDGFRWFVGLGCRVVCVAVGWRLWRSLMVEGMLLSLVVDDGLFKLALWRSVMVEGMLFDDVGWYMLVSL
jgi:hypothetical protein